MSLVAFDTLPDNSRLWIFAADRMLSNQEAESLLATLDSYLVGWKAHGAPVVAARELRYNQFLFIAANPEVTAPSGCSIDDMTRAIQKLSTVFSVDFFGSMNVFYRSATEVKVVSRAQFKSLAESGAVNAETIVFNNALTELSELRAGKWETPAGRSWHAAAFTLKEPA